MPNDIEIKLRHPIMWTWSTYTVQRMEGRLACIVDGMFADLREKQVSTIGDALRETLTWRLATSHYDLDILGEGRWEGN